MAEPSGKDHEFAVETWLREENPEPLEVLFSMARSVRELNVGKQVHLRGLVEFSNLCIRQCAYCGIRAGNTHVSRYIMSLPEILECAGMAHGFGYGTVVLQSGEDENISPSWVADVIRAIKDTYPLAVTLSLGERRREDYRLWKEKGADRCLLKFETSDPMLYHRIHPQRYNGEPNRVELLRELRGMGYEIGSGIMVGLPGQTYASIAYDLNTFVALDLDMVGIGPYIPHPDTPLGRRFIAEKYVSSEQAPNTDTMACKVVALTRILCPQANIPATTALASVNRDGYLLGLLAGANVVMPNITPVKYRKQYDIYPKTEHLPYDRLHSGVCAVIAAAGLVPGVGRGSRVGRRF